MNTQNQTRIRIEPALWLLLFLIAFPQISETIYSPALPNIAQLLHTSNHLVQWTLSVYFIGFALGVFLWGSISDHIGRRMSMLLGLSCYGASCVLCLVSPSISWLLVARIFQGMGASSGSVVTQTIAREALSDQRRNTFYSYGGFVLGFATTLGPFIGGYLTDWFGWRANFSPLVVIAIALLMISYFLLPETNQSHKHKSQQPHLNLWSLFKIMIRDKHVLASSWIIASVNGILFSYYAESPFIFIRIVKLTPSQYGWLGCLIAVAVLLGMFVSWYVNKNWRLAKIMDVGIILCLFAMLLLLIISLGHIVSPEHKLLSVVVIMLPVMLLMFGIMGFIVPQVLSHALLNYKPILGRAGALFGLSYYIGVSFFTWGNGVFTQWHCLDDAALFFSYFGFISCSVFLGVAW